MLIPAGTLICCATCSSVWVLFQALHIETPFPVGLNVKMVIINAHSIANKSYIFEMTCSVQRSWILQTVLFSQHLRFLEEKTSWARSSLLGTSTFMQRTVLIMLSSLSFYDHCLNRLLRTKHCSVCYSSLLSLHSHSTMKLETVPRRHYIQHTTTQHTQNTRTHTK